MSSSVRMKVTSVQVENTYPARALRNLPPAIRPDEFLVRDPSFPQMMDKSNIDSHKSSASENAKTCRLPAFEE
jgi:hypothetical protein